MFNIEPSADIRTAAAVSFELKTGFVQAGFTEAQAMQLVCSMLAAQMTAGSGDK